MAETAGYRFVSWVRSGLAALLTPTSVATGPAGRPGLGVRVNVTRDHGPAFPVDRPIDLLGPGDVVGVDPRQVIRTDPHAGATDAEPNYLVQVELDRPDLPWLFSPFGVVGERIPPWIVLVVVAVGPGVSLTQPNDAPLPILSLDADAEPGTQLPDLGESWAWAHGQALVLPGEDVDAVLTGVPARNAARLVSPRRLDPMTRYLACVVPAFEAGRRAGLGLPLAGPGVDPLAPAWNTTATAVTLPVYYSFDFATGAGGDFESLARALRPRPLPDGVGEQPVYVGAAGAPLPELDGATDAAMVAVRGALVLPGSTSAAWPEPTRQLVRDGLRSLLDLPAQRAGRAEADGSPNGVGPAVVPPIYGQWAAARSTVPADGSEPTWLATLNLDPRARAVAALGAVLVAAEQERFMQEAWSQLGQVEDANRELRRAQMAREVRASMLRRHIATLPPGDALGVTAPVHRRVLAGTATVAVAIGASDLPDATVSVAFRRAIGPRTPLVRRLAPTDGTATRPVVGGLDGGALRMGSAAAAPDGLFGYSRAQPAGADVSPDVRGRLSAARQLGRTRPPRPSDPAALAAVPVTADRAQRLGTALGLPGAPVLEAARSFQVAGVAAARRVGAITGVPDDPARPALGVAAFVPELLERLDASATVTARLQRRVLRPDALQPRPTRDPLDDIESAPVLTEPVWELLRDHAPGLLLPGLDDIPQDTATLAEPNAAFTEAALVGLNHEMARELLWREYPTDQRGTSFRRFWGSAGVDDIGAMTTWTDGDLGAHSFVGPDNWLVLVLRGRLLFRYPSTVIYAAPDKNGRPDLTEEAPLVPAFRGRIDPDIAFLGFALPLAEARGDPGWWFVFEEQPTAPRFGLDVATAFGAAAGPVNEWNDLSWGHLAADAAGLAALTNLRADLDPPSPPIGPHWGESAAAMAAILAQQPVRIALRAVDLLPEQP